MKKQRLKEVTKSTPGPRKTELQTLHIHPGLRAERSPKQVSVLFYHGADFRINTAWTVCSCHVHMWPSLEILHSLKARTTSVFPQSAWSSAGNTPTVSWMSKPSACSQVASYEITAVNHSFTEGHSHELREQKQARSLPGEVALPTLFFRRDGFLHVSRYSLAPRKPC